jgi:hypothetical protein
VDKTLNNRQGPRVAVTDQIVGRIDTLIGAPTCEVAVIRIDDVVEGYEFRSGVKAEKGFAHGSRAADDVDDARALMYRDRDDNARRHVGVLALYDLCWGSDEQWLNAVNDEWRVYSHDHGWYFPPGRPPYWTESDLLNAIDDDHTFEPQAKDLAVDEIGRICERLRSISRDEIKDALMLIPKSWPVTDEELAVVGYFVERRMPDVADRLEKLKGDQA